MADIEDEVVGVTEPPPLPTVISYEDETTYSAPFPVEEATDHFAPTTQPTEPPQTPAFQPVQEQQQQQQFLQPTPLSTTVDDVVNDIVMSENCNFFIVSSFPNTGGYHLQAPAASRHHRAARAHRHHHLRADPLQAQPDQHHQPLPQPVGTQEARRGRRRGPGGHHADDPSAAAAAAALPPSAAARGAAAAAAGGHHHRWAKVLQQQEDSLRSKQGNKLFGGLLSFSS